MTKLEKLFATHAKDERNVYMSHRRRNWHHKHAILEELSSRAKRTDDQFLQIRLAKAVLRLAIRSITSVRKYGAVGP